MGIQALPATAVRALGSGQVLTDPISLIKELLDNSLDASATMISIEVSQNILDIIQVKDNGHGIPPEDREFMAVRYCTSKIRDFEDIQDCRSLGFRGEALASAAELAGGLVITTMVEGEKVATACTCDRVGRVIAKRPVGATKGTTVRATDFFKFLPVRRENAVKTAQKHISRLRTLLQKYYLSHPTCRFSLRILAAPQKGRAAGGRSEDIVYAPSKSVTEAVMKAVGKDVVGACEWIGTGPGEAADGGLENGKIGIEAFMAKPNSDPAIICKKPQCTNFVFVDNRPVSCARGTLKQILSLYKSYLKSASPSDSTISDPFLYLNLRCPPGAYDPNIEPAKDDVMFFHTDHVIKTVEETFKELYGELKNIDGSGVSGGKASKSAEMKTGGFELLLARKRDLPPTTVNTTPVPEIGEDEEELAAQEMDSMTERDQEPPVGFTPVNPSKASHTQARRESPERLYDRGNSVRPPMFSVTDAPSPEAVSLGGSDRSARGSVPAAASVTRPARTPKRRPTNWGFNMSGGYDEDEDEDEDNLMLEEEARIRSQLAEQQGDEAATRDITISNPWTAAKMNSLVAATPSPSSSGPDLSMTRRRTYRPPNRIDPSHDLGLSPQHGSSPPLHYSVTPVSTTRRVVTMFPTPGASSPLSPQGNPRIMQGWLKKAPQQDAAQKLRPSSPVAHRNPINHDYDEDGEGVDEEELRRYQKEHPEAVRSRAVEGKPKRRRLNDPEPDYDNGPPPGYDEDLPQTQPSKSPHKNRFLKAAAALSSQPLPEPEPDPIPPPKPYKKPPPQKDTRPLSLDTAPSASDRTTKLVKTATCPISHLCAQFSQLLGTDGYNRVISDHKLSIPRAQQGKIGVYYDIDNDPNDPRNEKIADREHEITWDVKKWMDRLAAERGIETEPFYLEFDCERGAEWERSIWIFREGDRDEEMGS